MEQKQKKKSLVTQESEVRRNNQMGEDASYSSAAWTLLG